MDKKTKIKMLLDGEKIWRLVAKNGKGRKGLSDRDKYRATEELGLADIYMGSCPACEIVLHLRKNRCKKCPLLFLWPSGCCGDKSPYACFDIDNGTPSDALKIARAFKKAAKDLEAE